MENNSEIYSKLDKNLSSDAKYYIIANFLINNIKNKEHLSLELEYLINYCLTKQELDYFKKSESGTIFLASIEGYISGRTHTHPAQILNIVIEEMKERENLSKNYIISLLMFFTCICWLFNNWLFS